MHSIIRFGGSGTHDFLFGFGDPRHHFGSYDLKQGGGYDKKTRKGDGETGNSKDIGLAHVEVHKIRFELEVFGKLVERVKNWIEMLGDRLTIGLEDGVERIEEGNKKNDLDNLGKTAGSGIGTMLLVELGLGGHESSLVVFVFFFELIKFRG